MNGEIETARDLECLHDEADLLEKAGLLSANKAEGIRASILSSAKTDSIADAYRALVRKFTRDTVDLDNHPHKIEWLLDALHDLRDAKVIDVGLVLSIRLKITELVRANVREKTSAEIPAPVDERWQKDQQACIQAGVLQQSIQKILDIPVPQFTQRNAEKQSFFSSFSLEWGDTIDDLIRHTPQEILENNICSQKTLDWIRTALFLFARLKLRGDSWEFSGNPDEYRSLLFSQAES